MNKNQTSMGFTIHPSAPDAIIETRTGLVITKQWLNNVVRNMDSLLPDF